MKTKRKSTHYKTVSDVVLLNSKAEEAVKSPKKSQTYDIEALLQKHTEPEVWLKHLTDDLLPFWTNDAAKNFTQNLFPTYRTNTGELLPENKEDWPEEYKAAIANEDSAGLIDTDYNFIKAHSRQTFAYGVAYNMTGNEQCLSLCKKGADALMSAFDKNGGMFTKQKVATGEWGENVTQRTSQDLAYGISGMAMYYYLTHDEKVLEVIIKAKDYIFKTYLDEGKGIFTWLPKQLDDNSVEIVAQLDQIYGYMMFLTPALPEPHKTQWKQELKMIANILIKRFYSQRYGFFWGSETENKAKDFGTAHTDFGHSVKTMWLIYEIGMLTDEISFVIFAREKIDTILKNAYVKENGSWARRFVKNPQTGNRELDYDKEWWGLAELDQACAILSLNDPSYLSYLNNTYDYWFKYMVDKDNHEIWHIVSAQDNKPLINYPKTHMWKNAFHSFEHALFGYLTSSELKNKSFSLYYAFPSRDEVDESTVSPYLFKGNIVTVVDTGSLEVDDSKRKKIKVTFNMLH